MPANSLQRFPLNTGITLGQGMHLGDQHEFGYFRRNGVPYPYTMALQDLMLQGTGVCFGNLGICEDAKAGINPINGRVSSDDIRHMLLAGSYFMNDFGRKISL